MKAYKTPECFDQNIVKLIWSFCSLASSSHPAARLFLRIMSKTCAFSEMTFCLKETLIRLNYFNSNWTSKPWPILGAYNHIPVTGQL